MNEYQLFRTDPAGGDSILSVPFIIYETSRFDAFFCLPNFFFSHARREYVLDDRGSNKRSVHAKIPHFAPIRQSKSAGEKRNSTGWPLKLPPYIRERLITFSGDERLITRAIETSRT